MTCKSKAWALVGDIHGEPTDRSLQSKAGYLSSGNLVSRGLRVAHTRGCSRSLVPLQDHNVLTVAFGLQHNMVRLIVNESEFVG